MYCGNCGTHNPEGGSFCIECGNALYNLPASKAPRRVETLAAKKPTAAEMEEWQNWENRIQGVIKGIAGGPMFLALVICYSLLQVLNIVAINDGGIMSGTHDAMHEAGITVYAFEEMFVQIEQVLSLVSFLTVLPGVLVAVGLWMIYTSAKSNNQKLGTSGLTFIRCVQTVVMLAVCLMLSVILISVISAKSELSDKRGTAVEALDSALTGLAIGMLIVGALVVTLYVKIITSISKVELTVQTSVPNAGVSRFVEVMCYISGVASILGLLTSGLTIAGILQSVSMILFGGQMYVYRDRMQYLESVYSHCCRKTNDLTCKGLDNSQNDAEIPTWKKIEMEEARTKTR